MKELFLLLVSLGNILHIKIIESNDTEDSPKGVSQMNSLVFSVKNSSLNITTPLDINYDEKYTIIDFQNDLLNSKKLIIKRLILNFENKNVFFISKAEELTFQSCELGGVKYLSDYDYYSDIFRSCKKNYISNCTLLDITLYEKSKYALLEEIQSNINKTLEELQLRYVYGFKNVFTKLLNFEKLKILDFNLSKSIEILGISKYSFTSVEYGIFNRIPNLKNLRFRSCLLNLNLHLIFGAISLDRIIDYIYICDSEISGKDIKYISTLKVKVFILIHTKNTLSEIYNNLCDDVIKQTLDGLKIKVNVKKSEADNFDKNKFLRFFGGLKYFDVE
ncbi:hypothetical protein CWI39_0674p0010 [Hamiltosporidium magnivora]|uniref:Leucine-rich repeat-containing protein n=1 Tax=Hamiltosporidium magnivora TaxID=148818 RepID=A0A4Q9LDI4_9MICR|nr:hypothetical protein CWI39_0674p0010 [Hamiltosporidium magnivora]